MTPDSSLLPLSWKEPESVVVTVSDSTMLLTSFSYYYLCFHLHFFLSVLKAEVGKGINNHGLLAHWCGVVRL